MSQSSTADSKKRGGLPSLPNSWLWAKLEDIGAIYSGGTPSTKDESNFGGDIPWITPADLSSYNQKYIQAGRRNLSKKGLDSSSAVLLPEGSVLFSSRAPIGCVAIAANPLATNQGFKSCAPHKGIFNEYPYYYLKASKKLAEEHASGTTFLEISGSRFAKLLVPVAPAMEQHRIVAKIEELFTKLDAGVEALKRAQFLLKKYKQAVLKAAVEGKLTEKWREEHKDEIEPASELLKRILKERREKWEAEHPGKKYKEPTPPDTGALPELPDGWCWATVDQFAAAQDHAIKRGPFGSAIKKAFFVPSGYKVYEQQHVIKKDFSLGTYYIDAEKFAELRAFEVRPGDVLITCSGTIGEIAEVPAGSEPGVINQALLKITLNEKIIHRQFFMAAFHAKRQEILLDSARGSAMKNISSVKDLKKIGFPLPPIQEQPVIVEELERLNSIICGTQEIIQSELARADHLRQSILKQAFSGKLVPQDPTDEPASVLLERIRAEKAKKEEKKKRKRSKPKSKGRQMRLIEDG